MYTPTKTFYEWGKSKRITDNPFGDFLYDLQRDETAAQVANDKESWLMHIGHNRAVINAFEEVWVAYQRSPHVPKDDKAGYVYFVCAGEDMFKIGMTTQNPYKRIVGLQTSHPRTLILYGYIQTDTPKALEMQIHQQLKDCHVKGEWFSIDPESVGELLDAHGGIYGNTDI